MECPEQAGDGKTLAFLLIDCKNKITDMDVVYLYNSHGE